jgi:hypothetical protein
MNLKTIRDRCTEDGDCWIWGWAVNSAGHPLARVNGKPGQMVRRVALLEFGKKPTGKYRRVTDLCGNKLCCNPEHLRFASLSEVMKKAADNNRSRLDYLRRVKSNQEKGPAKLTWEKVREIRVRLVSENAGQIAPDYGVSRRTIEEIKYGKAWREVSPW